MTVAYQECRQDIHIMSDIDLIFFSFTYIFSLKGEYNDHFLLSLQVALKLVKMVTMVAYSLSSEWKTYIEADNRIGVHTAPLRTLSEDVYDCLIPIKRPSRLDGLKVSLKASYVVKSIFDPFIL